MSVPSWRRPDINYKRLSLFFQKSKLYFLYLLQLVKATVMYTPQGPFLPCFNEVGLYGVQGTEQLQAEFKGLL